jgi:iron(III) transport system substrate-binding protein
VERNAEHVVLYTSQDQFYAEPILAQFTKDTGIEVRPVFDTESAKTAALAHRLRAEKSNPQCDVFWSNEEMHGHLLARDGVLVSDELRKVGFRTRQLVINTNFLQTSDAPKSLMELTQPKWKGKVALAYPLFGTTSYHFLALRQHWGDPAWREWCNGLIRNEAKVVDGNSVVVRLVGAGECWIGLTDSDDIAAGLRQALPIAAVPNLVESLVIGNTIALVKKRPTPARRARSGRLSQPP